MSHPNASTAVARTVIDELARNDVRLVVVAPGSRSAPLALAAAAHRDVEVVVGVDERSAGFFALGAGKAGDLAAVVVTSGSAVANLFPAIVEASTSSVPLVLLTADRPPELRGVGANQTIHQTEIFGSYPRLFVELGVGEDRPEAPPGWRATVCRSVAHARGALGLPGPVHINLAFREPLVPASDDGRVSVDPYRSDTEGRSGGVPWMLHARPIADAPRFPASLAEVERGLVVAGVGAHLEWCDKAAAALGWPLIAEASAGARPGQAISTAHWLAGVPRFVEAHRPDAVVVVGRTGLSRSVLSLIAGARRVTIDAGRWSDSTRSASLVMTAYPHLSGAMPERDGGWRRSWFEHEQLARTVLDSAVDADEGVNELRVARDTARGARGSVLVVASSMPIRDIDVMMEPGPDLVLSNRGASGIDGFVSTTLGVSSRRGGAVALAGDLSMLHDQNGFLVDRRPAAVFVVVDNDGGGIFSFLPQASFPDHFERLFGTPHGRSFERYAAFHDLEYRHIEDPDEITPAVLSAREAGGLHLIHLRTERSENVNAHRRVAEAVHRAVNGIA